MARVLTSGRSDGICNALGSEHPERFSYRHRHERRLCADNRKPPMNLRGSGFEKGQEVPDRFGNPNHQQVEIETRKGKIKVDSGTAPLVFALNELQEIFTCSSCEMQFR